MKRKGKKFAGEKKAEVLVTLFIKKVAGSCFTGFTDVRKNKG